MSQKITTEINYETMLKLERRARRAVMIFRLIYFWQPPHSPHTFRIREIARAQ